MNSNMVVVKALRLCRYQEIDLTVRPMHLRKKGLSGSLLQVTIELQYANPNDKVPSPSFILFWLHNRLKQVIKLHMVSGTRCLAWSDQVKRKIESRAAAPKGQCPIGHRGEFPDILMRPQMAGLGHRRRI